MKYVMAGEFPETCGACNEPRRYEGKGKRQTVVCGCEPEPVKGIAQTDTLGEAQNAPTGRRKCSKKGTKAKGDGEERKVVRAFEDWGFTAYRTAGSGAHGSRNNEQAFATDVRVKLGDFVVRVESKRHASVSGLATLLKMKGKSEILWVREDFGEAYVLMTATTFGQFAARAAEKA